ncbi:hypothetical protein TTHERM_00013230 (macronuclear) [Tetrahymena thermophila SB210]|uniref:Uncharacterized protein n=1 Tax=Tetrahymena thermophila (strain SB210) TaxID=312017 RepID=Q22RR5_TETTS|nr:hypothetical protein TTHERM_00013230 [Tetrahymena thermophila SB210]EAR88057.2 hypothetical protein TTHERM_00013230 [Tetrahymena thermophila SB210]|eukprot:XP_001008302.2 hypothetical protein TTHERM_00013230 [Tetrahymena thermophila SB210]
MESFRIKVNYVKSKQEYPKELIYDLIKQDIKKIYMSRVEFKDELIDEPGTTSTYDGSFFSFKIQLEKNINPTIFLTQLRDICLKYNFISSQSRKNYQQYKQFELIVCYINCYENNKSVEQLKNINSSLNNSFQSQNNSQQSKQLGQQQQKIIKFESQNNNSNHELFLGQQILNQQISIENDQLDQIFEQIDISDLKTQINALQQKNAQLENSQTQAQIIINDQTEKTQKLLSTQNELTENQNQLKKQLINFETNKKQFEEQMQANEKKNLDNYKELDSKIYLLKVEYDQQIEQIININTSSQESSKIQLKQFESTVDNIKQQLEEQNQSIQNIKQVLNQLQQNQINYEQSINKLQETIQLLQEKKSLGSNENKSLTNSVISDQDNLKTQSSQNKLELDLDEKQIETLNELLSQLKQTVFQSVNFISRSAFKMPLKLISFFSPFNLAKKALSILS